MKKGLLLVAFVSMFLSLVSQSQVTARIFKKKAFSVEPYFSQIDDYTNGVTLANYTILQIHYNDTVAGGLPNPTGNGWRLTVTPDGPIQSPWSGATLSVDIIDLRVEVNSVETRYTLSGGTDVIASGPDLIDYWTDITISYDFGFTNPITTVANDRFDVMLEFILEPNP